MCAGSSHMCYATACFLFALRVEDNVRTYRLVHLFDNISLGFQNGHSYLVNEYSSNHSLKMTR